jgi:hypothetical protein
MHSSFAISLKSDEKLMELPQVIVKEKRERSKIEKKSITELDLLINAVQFFG